MGRSTRFIYTNPRQTGRRPFRNCMKCGVLGSAAWRKGLNGEMLCNKCGLRSKREHNKVKTLMGRSHHPLQLKFPRIAPADVDTAAPILGPPDCFFGTFSSTSSSPSQQESLETPGDASTDQLESHDNNVALADIHHSESPRDFHNAESDSPENLSHGSESPEHQIPGSGSGRQGGEYSFRSLGGRNAVSIHYPSLDSQDPLSQETVRRQEFPDESTIGSDATDVSLMNLLVGGSRQLAQFSSFQPMGSDNQSGPELPYRVDGISPHGDTGGFGMTSIPSYYFNLVLSHNGAGCDLMSDNITTSQPQLEPTHGQYGADCPRSSNDQAFPLNNGQPSHASFCSSVVPSSDVYGGAFQFYPDLPTTGRHSPVPREYANGGNAHNSELSSMHLSSFPEDASPVDTNDQSGSDRPYVNIPHQDIQIPEASDYCSTIFTSLPNVFLRPANPRNGSNIRTFQTFLEDAKAKARKRKHWATLLFLFGYREGVVRIPKRLMFCLEQPLTNFYRRTAAVHFEALERGSSVYVATELFVCEIAGIHNKVSVVGVLREDFELVPSYSSRYGELSAAHHDLEFDFAITAATSYPTELNSWLYEQSIVQHFGSKRAKYAIWDLSRLPPGSHRPDSNTFRWFQRTISTIPTSSGPQSAMSVQSGSDKHRLRRFHEAFGAMKYIDASQRLRLLGFFGPKITEAGVKSCQEWFIAVSEGLTRQPSRASRRQFLDAHKDYMVDTIDIMMGAFNEMNIKKPFHACSMDCSSHVQPSFQSLRDDAKDALQSLFADPEDFLQSTRETQAFPTHEQLFYARRVGLSLSKMYASFLLLSNDRLGEEQPNLRVRTLLAEARRQLVDKTQTALIWNYLPPEISERAAERLERALVTCKPYVVLV